MKEDELIEKIFRITLIFSFLLTLVCANPEPLRGYDRPAGRIDGSRSAVIAGSGMVCASQPLAVQVGIDILKKGGSAVDAAIAVNAALGLMEPVGCGIGGDLFAIVWDAGEEKLFGLNASGRAPLSLTIDKVRELGYERIPFYGPVPQTVPGCVDGWYELHGRFGRLEMEEILAPAIKYAEEGFPVTEIIAHYWKRGAARLKDYPNFAETYMPGGSAPSAGEVFRNPDLAETYRMLAEGGRDIFYEGEIAERIDSFERRNGGFLRIEDFRIHSSTWVTPVSALYRGYRVWELPPNGQGIAALQILNILSAYDLKRMGHNSAEYLHHLIEAKKIAYEDRARYYSDPDFARIPVEKLISPAYADERRKLLDPESASRIIEPGDIIIETGETTYLTVADSDRNFVSLIQSNYAGFGSGPVPDGLGFCLQDRGALFNLDPEHPNSLEPGKRPFHTIIPAMVTKNGDPVFSFGVMGGAMQPQGHVQILCNIIDFGMGVQEAGDAPRFRHIGSSQPTGEVMEDGGRVALESGIGAGVIRDLISRGHRVVSSRGGFGGYQGIWYDSENDILIGGTEARKDGCAAGY